jgi:hypothetical protein
LSAALACGEDVRRLPPERLLAAIFELAGGPIAFDRVIALAAEAWGIKDQPAESFETPEGESRRELVDTSQRVDVLFEHRLYLSSLWVEVVKLPMLQRAALLLNLRDGQGGGVIAFIPHLGLASLAEMAEMLGMAVEQLSALWNELPLDDARGRRARGTTARGNGGAASERRQPSGRIGAGSKRGQCRQPGRFLAGRAPER